MKRLILMRHAKSDWSGGATSDHDRLLNARGRAGATALGDWLKASGLTPDEVLCSSAERTRETLTRLKLPDAIATGFTRKLYLASAQEILTELRDATKDVVLLLGHNPGIAECAEGLLAHAPDHPRFGQYPTGATLVADFAIANWADLAWQSGQIVTFVTPHDLPDAD